MNPTKTQAIQRFLAAKTHADLAAMYTPEMECQVNVAKDNGEPEQGEFKGKDWRGFTDGVQHWKPIRIPWKANSVPEFVDSELKWDLEAHAEAIGMTGWNWVKRQSEWVAFDFDAIIGHSEKHSHRLSQTELAEIQKITSAIPWVTIRKSTSGKGLHVYVFLEPTATENHNEHAALARAILGQMSALTSAELGGKVDIAGSNMWVWHRKMVGTDGLTLIKSGSVLPTNQIPQNWREHLKVVTGQKRKVSPTFIGDSEETPDEEKERLFNELCGQVVHQPLDSEHKKLIEWLGLNNCSWWWDADHHMLVTHTAHLADAHKAMGYKGIFKTASSHSSTHNCFAYPMRRGSWVIRRYTAGVKEDDSWEQDGKGWTRCYYNREPDLSTLSRSAGAVEHPTGGYVFREAEIAMKTLNTLGAVNTQLPPAILTRSTRIKSHKDGNRLIAEVDYSTTDNHIPGWLLENNKWKRVFSIGSQSFNEPEIPNYDDLIRHLVTESGEDFGWLLKSDRIWRVEPLAHIKLMLGARGENPKEAGLILGDNVSRPWTICNRPFQPEYPGDRLWNRNSPQLRYLPKESKDGLNYSTWMKILNHCGKGLDDAIKENVWAKTNGVLTGADYLKLWLASIFQQPEQPLPYLFLWSTEENTGKSIFHESLNLLITSGITLAGTALINPQGFNAELMHSVVCAVEELDLRKNASSYGRIKDWVTSPRLVIHEKGETPYTIQNTTHWIHTANSQDFCPVFPGDTRITMINVPPLDILDMIPKKDLLPLLEKEAQDFITELLSLEIPPSHDRLNVPVIITQEKIDAAEANKSLLERFLDERCFAVAGSRIKFSDFYDKFIEWLPAEEISKWSKIGVGRAVSLGHKYLKGRNKGDGQWYLGNISWTPKNESIPELPKLVLNGEMLVEPQTHS